MNANVIIDCPEMAVHHVKMGLSRTEQITADVTVLGFPKVYKGLLTFPPTDVEINNPHEPRYWTVKECKAESNEGSFLRIVSNLPPEPCELKIEWFEGLHVYMLAMAILAPTTITIPNIGTGVGDILYPDAKAKIVSRGVWVVQPVKAIGTLVFPDQPG